MGFTTENTTIDVSESIVTDSSLNTEFNTTLNDTSGGFYDATGDSGNNYSGLEQSQYIFEARQEYIDITAFSGDFQGTRRKTQNFDLIFHVPMKSADMNAAFCNFGMPQLQAEGSTDPTNDLSGSVTTTKALRVKLLKHAQGWFKTLNAAVTQGANATADMSGQLTRQTDASYFELNGFDTSGTGGVTKGSNAVENWNEMLYEMGMVLTKYFGNKLTNSGKVITRASVKSMLGSKNLMQLFPLSDNQIILDGVRWRSIYWPTKRYTPFTPTETDKMSIAFPFNYTYAKLAEDGVTAINTDRVEFTAKIEWHYVDMGDGNYSSTTDTNAMEHANTELNANHAKTTPSALAPSPTTVQWVPSSAQIG